MGTREGKKTATRRALADAAVRLFAERGYDEVTMEDVAEAVGVSRRTAFRYFPAKGDLVMAYPAEWREVFNQVLADEKQAPIEERLRTASYAVAAHIEQDPAAVRQLFALAYANPSLTAAYAVNTQEWIGRVAEEIGTDLDGSPEAAVRAGVLAAAFMGMINSVCELWATGDQPMRPLLDVGLDLLGGAFATLDGDGPQPG